MLIDVGGGARAEPVDDGRPGGREEQGGAAGKAVSGDRGGMAPRDVKDAQEKRVAEENTQPAAPGRAKGVSPEEHADGHGKGGVGNEERVDAVEEGVFGDGSGGTPDDGEDAQEEQRGAAAVGANPPVRLQPDRPCRNKNTQDFRYSPRYKAWLMIFAFRLLVVELV